MVNLIIGNPGNFLLFTQYKLVVNFAGTG